MENEKSFIMAIELKVSYSYVTLGDEGQPRSVDATRVELDWPGHHIINCIDGLKQEEDIVQAVTTLVREDQLHKADQLLHTLL
ncbi:hypothetical protein MYX06_01590 [Patescibacteria group bacterium AH-259-L05]|nr:hypothetical protein [Patescibacteria group bacterium AH-259-L05]